MMGRDPEQLIHSLRQLPQSAAPPRDLWPGIKSRLAPRRSSWAVPASLAAGVLIAALGFVIGTQVRDTTDRPALRDSGALRYAALRSDPGYELHREELLRALPAKLAGLPTESQQRLRNSLLAVQQAMQNIKAELGRDSGNALLQELLISTSQEEMRVLTAVDEFGGPHQEIGS
jgi:hypothetical protein